MKKAILFLLILFSSLCSTLIAQTSQITTRYTPANTLSNTLITVAVSDATSQSEPLSNFLTKTTSPVLLLDNLAVENSCSAPTPPTISTIGLNNVNVNWAAVPSAVGYIVQYKPSSDVTWSSALTFSSVLTLSGLISGTLYDVQVIAVCSLGQSMPSSTVRFTTLSATCPIPTPPTISNIGFNGVNLNWAEVSGATGYIVQYKPSNGTTWSSALASSPTLPLNGLTAGTSYDVQVITVCSFGQSAPSSTVSFTTLSATCPIPMLPTISNIGLNSVNVNWTAVPGAIGYLVQHKPNSSAAWSSTLTVSSTLTLNDLTAGTLYDVQVITVCSFGQSNPSSTVGFTTLSATSCSTPTPPTISNVDLNSVNLNWAAVPSAIGYIVQYKPNGSATWSSALTVSSTLTLNGLTARTSYDVQITTVCSLGQSTPSSAVSFTTLSTASCSTTTPPTITNVRLNSVNVNWTAVPNAVGYIIQYKSNNSGIWLSSLAFASTALTLSGLTPETRYDVQIITVCSLGQSAPSSTVSFATLSVTCPPPTATTISNIGFNSVNVSWTAAPSITSYIVQYKPNSSTTWSSAAASSSTTLTLNGLTAGIQYDVRVIAACSMEQSTPSNTVSFTTLSETCSTPTPAPPTISNIGFTSVNVNWTAVPNVTSYMVQYKPSNNTTTTWSSVLASSSTTLTLEGLTSGTLYDVQVRTVCSTGQGNPSNTVNFTTLTIACPSPIQQNPSSITSNGANISWTAVSGAMGYIVRYRRETAFDWTSTPVTSSTTLRLEGLTEGASYYVQVTAVCSSEQSTPSNTFIFTTTIQCPATQVTSVDVTPTRARVNWAAITAGATGYIVRFKKDSESDWTTMPATTSTSLLLGDLTVSTLYNLQVITVCYLGQSSPSNTVNFTTLSSACPEPTQFYPINISSNGATINWSAVSEATGYIVQYRSTIGATWTSSPIISSTEWALQGLTAGIWYNVQVTTVCAFGQSKLSNTASFRTSTAFSGPNTVSMSGLATTKASSSQKMGQHSDMSIPDILKRSFDIVISPNPTTTGKVYVNIESTEVGDVYVKVCDILGHVVWQNALTLEKGSLIQQEIDISDRKNGLYFIHLTDGKGLNTVKRLVVQR